MESHNERKVIRGVMNTNLAVMLVCFVVLTAGAFLRVQPLIFIAVVLELAALCLTFVLNARLNKAAQANDTAVRAESNSVYSENKPAVNTEENINEFIQHVKESVEVITYSSEEMKHSSGEMSDISSKVTLSISQLAEGATQQAESTEKGSTRINNITEMIICIGEDMAASDKVSDEAMAAMADVKESIRFQEEKMTENKVITENMEVAITDLMEKSKEIGKILEVIKGVAQQTNLLALNAAIEAARAGEHGRGFAVVSEEIRKLAEQSAESGKQITEIINDVQQGIENTVMQIKTANTLSQEQGKAFEQTVSSISDISEKVSSIGVKVKAAAGATKTLTDDAREAEDMIATIASISEETAAGTQEASSSVEEQNNLIQLVAECSNEMSNIAQVLKEKLEAFNLE
ncbi:Methyl-accepting chemotaxis protein [Anaerocolumna jejuensis DSM 15929]|uniref:Methyl-accepting chemotaxis protein n=1 Tax=Anaerocolumna jejuensis DSM 15929 TaxID=1121322 RepID=A0A1M6V0D9_9FIRM|nr:methyl-accepting chemotaxis protein [Anaerocolumna jejuensis]SHK74776.1 Methyl-accepting chemotaxis protein [Anaerocolumna jejuensis DSM 15929]